MLVRVLKIDFMILVALVVLHSRQHAMTLCWVLVLSIGFYGFKGGLFTLATGGSYRVWGPVDSFIEGNNELALALIMIIPLMRFLQLNVASAWVRRLLLAAMVLSAVAALGSHSRGALIALCAMGAVMWWRSENKLRLGALLLVIGASLVGFMPDEWSSRMETIGTYEEDASAMGRINAWHMAFNLAKANFFGGGFSIYTPAVFATYAPHPEDIHAAHSIYFQVLGEHGFVGLLLYLLLWLFVWGTAGQLRKQGARRPETLWVSQLGAMTQVSIVGFAVGGAFLSLAYFDLPYNLLVLVVLAKSWLKREAWKRQETPQPVLPAWLTRRPRPRSA
jgi:probable O-glycosylation ligase (exosortase A-associated)